MNVDKQDEVYVESIYACLSAVVVAEIQQKLNSAGVIASSILFFKECCKLLKIL